MDTIITEISEIKESLNDLHKKIDQLLEDQRKINHHVDFVEDVYSTVQKPLNYICNKFSGTHKALPSPE